MLKISGHRKKSGHMNCPAKGYYSDCSCGRIGALRITKAEADQDHQDHLRQVALEGTRS